MEMLQKCNLLMCFWAHSLEREQLITAFHSRAEMSSTSILFARFTASLTLVNVGGGTARSFCMQNFPWRPRVKRTQITAVGILLYYIFNIQFLADQMWQMKHVGDGKHMDDELWRPQTERHTANVTMMTQKNVHCLPEERMNWNPRPFP